MQTGSLHPRSHRSQCAVFPDMRISLLIRSSEQNKNIYIYIYTYIIYIYTYTYISEGRGETSRKPPESTNLSLETLGTEAGDVRRRAGRRGASLKLVLVKTHLPETRDSYGIKRDQHDIKQTARCSNTIPVNGANNNK